MRKDVSRVPAKNYQPDFISGREPLYTVPEAARLMKLARSTVWKLIRSDQLGYVLKAGLYRKVYHVPESALRAYENVRSAEEDLHEAKKANRRLVIHLGQVRDRLGGADSRKRRKKQKGSG